MNKYNNFSETVQTAADESLITDAYNISKADYSKADIVRILSENNDNIKPIAIINLKSLENKFEAELLLEHLTGEDGRIREAVSYMLNEIPNAAKFYTDEKSKKILIKGISDINPNVVRNVICFLENNENLKKELLPLMIAETTKVLEGLSAFLKGPFRENREKSSKNHAKNKLTFNLYWLLEALSISNPDNNPDLINILTKTANFLDYTIREKTALVLSKMENPPDELLHKLKNDENIYVKNQLL